MFAEKNANEVFAHSGEQHCNKTTAATAVTIARMSTKAG
jgi:hypothetical protein